MKPRIIFPDAQLAVIELLRSTIGTVSQSFATGTTFGTKVPDDRSIDTASLPYVLIRMDGSSLARRLDEEATIRISVWHKTEAQGLALAQALRALLLSHEGNSSIRVITPLSGPVPTSDPESGDPLSTFTVAVRLRPQTL